MIKIFTQNKKKYFIPIIALILGIIVSTFCYITSREILPQNITFIKNFIAGILCGLSSTGLHQLLTNLHNFICQNKNNQALKKERIITLKNINYHSTTQQNPPIINNNRTSINDNELCKNCPYKNCEEPETVNKKHLLK